MAHLSHHAYSGEHVYSGGKSKKVNFKFYDVTAWLTNNCRTHIALNSGSKGNQRMKFGLLTECNMRNIFLEKSYKNVVKELEHKIEQISGSIV